MMVRTLIVGIDTVAGRSLAKSLVHESDVSGLWFANPEFIAGCQARRLDPDALLEQIAEADAIVFCGGAAQSSWDADFGDFEREDDWLAACIAAIDSSAQRLIFISSDAVFCGPWLFHDDDSSSLAADELARRLLKQESCVKAVSDSLIVRTNVLDASGESFLNAADDAISAGNPIKIEASIFATPIAAANFGEALATCITSGTSGYVNIGGAERLTPFQFAMALANHLSLDTSSIEPLATNRGARERSMRCQRLRLEHKQSPPLMANTVEHLADLFRQQLEECIAA